MVKHSYLHNYYRKQLTTNEKKRYNLYKKRECERRRRLVEAHRENHPNYFLHRCECCRKFFSILYLLFGFIVCETCTGNTKKLKHFLYRKFTTEEEMNRLTDNNVNLYIVPPQKALLEALAETTKTNTETECELLGAELKNLAEDLYREIAEYEFALRYPETMMPFHYDEWFEHDCRLSFTFGKIVE